MKTMIVLSIEMSSNLIKHDHTYVEKYELTSEKFCDHCDKLFPRKAYYRHLFNIDKNTARLLVNTRNAVKNEFLIDKLEYTKND